MIGRKKWAARLLGLVLLAALADMAGEALAPALAQPAPAAGGRIAYAQQGGKDASEWLLRVMDADGRNDREIPNQPGRVNWMPAWSPDGQQIAFVSGPAADREEFGLYVMDADGKNVRRLAPEEGMVSSPAWSPDGQTILFLAHRTGGARLMTAAMDGSPPAEVPLPLIPQMAPFYSPDGKQIGVTATAKPDDPVASQIYTFDLEGTGLRKQTSGPGPSFAGPHAWSGARGAIVFISLDATRKPPHLHTWNLENKEETHLADLKIPADLPPVLARPGWSPDGRWVVLSHLGSGGKPALWKVSADGRTQQRLTPAGAASVSPAWSR